MNAKEAIESIKKLVFGEQNPTPEPDPSPEVFGTEYKLADGTPIMIDKLEVGGIAKLGDVVAPDGTHFLEDGTEFEIKDGVISMVKAKEPEIEIEMGDKLQKMQAQFEAIQEEVKTLKGEFAKVSVKADTQQKANEELVKLVEFLAEEPAANPIQPEVKFEEMTPLEKFRFRKQMQN